MRRLALVFWLALTSACFGQVPSPAVNTASPPPPTLCANATIPTGNTVANTAVETAFAATCVIQPAQLVPGSAVFLHVGGVYSAGTAQNARGRVRMTQSGTPNLASDPILIDTGAVGGLAASTNQEWFGDIWITIQSGASTLDVQGALTFQTGANTTVTVPIANTAPFALSPTQALTLYLSVQWGAASASNSMQLRTMVAK